MKRIALVLVGLVFALAGVAPALGADKVTICHAAGLAGTTKYVTLTIGRPAVYGPAGHFYENGTPRAGHEQDYLGPCQAVTPPPTDEPTETPTPPEETPPATEVAPPASEPSVTPPGRSVTPPKATPTPKKTDEPKKRHKETPPPVAHKPPSSGPNELAPTGLSGWALAGIGAGLLASGLMLFFGVKSYG